jgi:prevent-host-death family protein
MMESVGVLEAKTHWSQLLERVERGETIQIAKRGQPVALLMPSQDTKKRNVREVVERIKKLGERNTLGPGLTIKDLINEGRRF